MVAVFQQVAGSLNAPGTQVYCHHHVGARLLAPRGELVDAHQVWLGAAPGQLQPPGTLVHRADAVLPIEVGDKVAAGIADNGYADFPNQIQYVPPEAFLIRRGVARLINAAVHGPA